METWGLSPATAEKLAVFAERVAASPHNLVSTRARSELHARHIPESLEFARILPNAGRLLDIGSGGGFPGMVVALVRPSLEVHLLDATVKKVTFLEALARELGVDVHVHAGRAEVLSQGELGASFTTVTARAVAPLRRLAGWAAPFLRPSGTLYAIKGKKWAEELEDAQVAIATAGLRVVATPDDDPRCAPQASLRPTAPRVVMLRRVV